MRSRIFWPLLLTVALLAAACSSDNPGQPDPQEPMPPAGFVLIEAGTFTMGSPADELGRYDTELQHEVTLTHDYWIQATEVTNEQYRVLAQWALDQDLVTIEGDTNKALLDLGGSGQYFYALTADGSELDYDAEGDTLILYDVGFGINPDHPLKYVTWAGAAAYCNWLSLREGRTPAYDPITWTVDDFASDGYRLPTEAEWEYAARAGSATAFAGSQIQTLSCDGDSLTYQGWYCHNARDWARQVGQLQPNANGLYDMHGNVYEYCNDWYGQHYYEVSPDTDPVGPTEGFLQVVRGGAWGIAARNCRSATRAVAWPNSVSEVTGFRPILID